MVTLSTEGIERPSATRALFLGAGALALLFFLAIGARLVGLTLFITPDEDNWMRRAGGFAWGLANSLPPESPASVAVLTVSSADVTGEFSVEKVAEEPGERPQRS